jgi:hypothetical protein
LFHTNVSKNQDENGLIFRLKKELFCQAEKPAVINKKNIYQQSRFEAFAIFKIDTFAGEISYSI